jgi:hypothetical protein
MVNMKQYLDKNRRRWWRAEDFVVGDRLIFLDAGKLDEETFDRPYINIPARLQRTNEERILRLGFQNVQRLMQDFNTEDTNDLVKQCAEIITIQTYPGLGTKGYLLRGIHQTNSTQQRF